jgi:hypothetical protein
MIKFIDILNELNQIIPSEKPVEDSSLTKALNAVSGFLKGKEVQEWLNKIKEVNGAKFDDYTLKYKNGQNNQFIIDIIKDKDKVGSFVAMLYKDKDTNQISLQIQKVEIYPEYKGKSIMRNFYQSFNKWLQDNFPNFDKFTSDFVFLYNKQTGKYDGFNMWEDLVKKGLATRLGPDEDYTLPSTPPKNGMWSIKSGYKLKE